MTATPWTPGPWKDEVVWSDAFGSRLRGSDGRVVAELSIELAPDLRLIAAAPEMADTIADLLRHGEHDGPCDPDSDWEGCTQHVAASEARASAARALLERIRGA